MEGRFEGLILDALSSLCVLFLVVNHLKAGSELGLGVRLVLGLRSGIGLGIRLGLRLGLVLGLGVF